jgi:aspartyl aminopeptidase
MQKLITFLQGSPTAWHAVANMRQQLDKRGFTPLHESETWKLKHGKGYYVVRDGSSLIAFVIPRKAIHSAKVAASHTDSPAFKLKPNAPFVKEGMLMLGVDIYGGPLLNSWLNRDLGIAGRIFSRGKNNSLVETLVNIADSPVVIPQLAIHLDRDVNTQGLVLHKQNHLAALAKLDCKDDKEAGLYLSKLLGVKDILSSDLFLYPIEPPAFVGPKKEMLAAYRIDSLCSVHSILEAFLASSTPAENTLKLCAFWDNEEIGSATAQGASSPFFSETVERLIYALNGTRADYLRIVSSSLCVSVDLGHGVHPNYADKHEPQHKVKLGQGITLKYSAQQRYASTAATAGYIKALCGKNKIPFQELVGRGDLSSGSTIGPIHANLTGMPTVDIGIPQLSMHSARELIACSDQAAMTKLIECYYS